MDSILNSTKKMLGIDASYTHFDTDLIMHINTVFMTLQQLGAGPFYSISGEGNTWDEYLSSGEKLEAVKSYVYLKARMLFDPPQTSSVAEAVKANISELEWRINVAVDPGEDSN